MILALHDVWKKRAPFLLHLAYLVLLVIIFMILKRDSCTSKVSTLTFISFKHPVYACVMTFYTFFACKSGEYQKKGELVKQHTQNYQSSHWPEGVEMMRLELGKKFAPLFILKLHKTIKIVCNAEYAFKVFEVALQKVYESRNITCMPQNHSICSSFGESFNGITVCLSIWTNDTIKRFKAIFTVLHMNYLKYFVYNFTGARNEYKWSTEKRSTRKLWT